MTVWVGMPIQSPQSHNEDRDGRHTHMVTAKTFFPGEADIAGKTKGQ